MYLLILSCLCALTKSKFWIILTISSWEKVTEYQGLLVNYWICVGRVLTLLIGNTALKKVNWNLQLFPSNYLPILHANMIKKKKEMVWVTLVCLNLLKCMSQCELSQQEKRIRLHLLLPSMMRRSTCVFIAIVWNVKKISLTF